MYVYRAIEFAKSIHYDTVVDFFNDQNPPLAPPFWTPDINSAAEKYLAVQF